jgi:carboxylate-amine ligase
MRMSDICTRLDDGICIAAVYRCCVSMLYRLRLATLLWRRYTHLLLVEFRWRAQRYGYDNGLIDFGKSAIIPYAELLEEMLLLIREDAEHFGCVAEVEHAREIINRGTSAHWQLATYERAKTDGASDKEALHAVVDMLIEETVYGL